ncbi:hypothetical protein EUGRSUZ_H03650 [Eucalyptus grandis]|uniref:Uncharacterized protein n=2 Tax=Eucalyptus grandis TaxID=71139 RepID=A0ACC3JUT6_EUCGR|nr:hypothetical protein EUGRSUZ_H03650 [Eucalyptus grandis]
MGTEILRPQDCLAGRMGAAAPAAYPRRRSCSDGSSSANPRPHRRHHQHQQRKRPVVPGQPEQLRPGGLATGKAAVLRRGDGPVVVSGSGPEPEMARKQAIAPGGRAVVYAGSAFAVSPEPSSLPLPSFSKDKKKQALLVDDSATRDLRRLLRLDLL